MSTHGISTLLLSSVSQLNGKNYYDWKFAVTQVLRFTGTLSVINGTEERPALHDKTTEWDHLAEHGLTVIGLTVEPSQYVYIRDTKSSPLAWTALQAQYQKKSRANHIALKRQLYSTQQDPSAPIREYTSRILDTATRLHSIGVTFKDEDIVDVLIFNLHPDWSNVAMTLTTSQGNLKTADIVSTLEDEESHHNLKPDPNYPSVLYAHGLHSHSPTTRMCYTCGKPSHIARDCSQHTHATQDDSARVNVSLAKALVGNNDYVF